MVIEISVSPPQLSLTVNQENESGGGRASARNRKRSKRRGIYCPIHNCYLDSVSQKHPLFADKIEHLRERGKSKKVASLVVNAHGAVAIEGEWLESFWCNECRTATWYHVHKQGNIYSVFLAPDYIWQQATGVIDPKGNPSVGEYTKTHARNAGLSRFTF